MKYSLYALLIGFLLDLVLGDPHWLYHPVRLIGHLITVIEKAIRKIVPQNRTGELVGGIVFSLIVLVISTMIPICILCVAGNIHPHIRFFMETMMCYQLLATKSLKTESMKVHDALANQDIEGARAAVAMIVGRDTKCLNEQGIVKATVETIAENASDGVIAPIFYMMLGGAPLGFFYKAINTMDSMVGYKNERYLYFGRCAAKLDDVANYIPARISAFFMILAAYLLRLDGKNSWNIFVRDRYNHASPNSAQTEAVMAGALQVTLAGDAYYFGVLHKKETIGDDIYPIQYQHILVANRLMYTTGFLVFTMVWLVTLWL